MDNENTQKMKQLAKELVEDLKELNEMVKEDYKPQFLSWTKSYSQEVEEFRQLILGKPADVKLLKQEYEQLTGKRFRRKRGE